MKLLPKDLYTFGRNNLDLIFATFLMAIIFNLSPYLHTFQNNPDEGLNLAKAMLHARGHQLYQEIWNDQPPFFTILLNYTMQIFGENIEVARNLIYALSVLLIFSVSRILNILYGNLTAVIGATILVLSPYYIFLSSSVMIGLPAISLLATSQLLLLYWHRYNKLAFLILAVITFTLASLTKLFCLILLPVFLIGIILTTAKTNPGSLVKPLKVILIFLVTTIITVIAINSRYIQTETISQLLAPHLLARTAEVYLEKTNLGFKGHYSEYWIFLLGGFLGGIISLIKKNSLGTYLFSCFLIIFIAIIFHYPVWFHHLLLLAVPASMLTAISMTYLSKWIAVRLVNKRYQAMLSLGFTITLTIIITTSHKGAFTFLNLSHPQGDVLETIENKIVRYLTLPKSNNPNIFTDLPIFAFRSKISPLPEFAVISEKRQNTGFLTTDQILKGLQKSNADYILLGRFDFPELKDYLKANYLKLRNTKPYRLYIRKEPLQNSTCQKLIDCLDLPPNWYASKTALRLANRIVKHQNLDGGWRKNIDLSLKPKKFDRTQTHNIKSTIDNNATTQEIRFLAKVGQLVPKKSFQDAINRGINFLINNQYPNGGWAQVYPIKKKNYTTAITFNDNAMVNVLRLLQDINKNLEFQIITEPQQIIIKQAISRGIQLILKTQLTVAGKPTAWAMQYHPVTLQPVQGRSYEPPSISGKESVEIIRFLMGQPEQTEDIIIAIDNAVNWFKDVAIPNLEVTQNSAGKYHIALKKDSPPIWARFYDLKTNRPIFQDRDGTLSEDFSQLSKERSENYEYFTYLPDKLINKEYSDWKKGISD